MNLPNEDNVLAERHAAADRVMVGTLVVHLLVCLGVAAVNGTWTVALVVGLPALLIPALIVHSAPGALVARLSTAVAFMVFSALLIQQTRGQIEAHFGIFALLAFLLYYRDWRPILAAAAVIAVHHVAFNFLQTDGSGIYVFQNGANFSTVLIHAAYVVLEAGLLIYMAVQLRNGALESVYVAQIAERVAGGDLVVDPAYRQERLPMLMAMSAMQQGLGKTLGQVRDEAETVLANARSLSAASSQVGDSTATQSQLASAMQTSAEQLSAAVADLTSKVGDASEMAKRSGECAEQGGQVVKSAIDEMRAISSMIGESSANVDQLGSQADRIVAVVSLIKDIANQTNLLALNAAIEAARAGEQGRGFAVVADEVRKLAERTSQATEEIDGMMQQVSATKGAALTSIAQAVERVAVGVDYSAKASVSIDDITRQAASVLGVVSEISAALQRQSTFAGEISRNVATVAESANASRRSAVDVDQVSTTLTLVAQRLQESVARFRT